MAKITALPTADQLTGDEHLPIVQGAETKRATMAALRDIITPYLQYWYKGDRGAAGAASNTRLTIDELKAAPITDATSTFDGSLWTWMPGDFTGQADDLNIVEAHSTALTAGAWVRQKADGVQHQRAGTPAILSTAKLLDALGVIPQQFGWDGLPTSDATAYVQMAADYCTAATQVSGNYDPALIGALPLTKPLMIPGMARITETIQIKNRAVDRTLSRFLISGLGNGGFLADGNFVLFGSSQPDVTDVNGRRYPDTEFIEWSDLTFVSRDPANTAFTHSPQFLRQWFTRCEWWRIACLAADRYSQEWYFTDCMSRGLSGPRAFFSSLGAYVVQSNNFKFWGAEEVSKGAFDLFDETGLSGVVGCYFNGGSYESSFGPFLRAGQCQGVSVEKLYTEGNSGAILDFRTLMNGGTNRGVLVQSCEFNAKDANVADPTFFNIWWGPGGGDSRGNSSRGGLHRNFPRVETENGITVGAGCSVGSLTTDDRYVGASKRYEMDLDRQVPLIPDPLSGYASKVTARYVLVDPLNGVVDHTVALPYPEMGLEITLINRRAGPTESFTVWPNWAGATGARFRGGSPDTGRIQQPGEVITYVCMDEGVWDVIP